MKALKVLALTAVMAFSSLSVTTPAVAASPAAMVTAAHSSTAEQARVLGYWVLIGWYPTLGECTRAAAAYGPSSCTQHDGGWMLYVYRAGCGGVAPQDEAVVKVEREC